MSHELPKTYDPSVIEERWAEYWVRERLFDVATSEGTQEGVKKFTMLYYLGPKGREDWGTDVYADADTWVLRAPFTPGHALMFVPSDNTWHGFEARRLDGVRKSVIINYVTDEWRAREQLAFPDRPVSGRG